MTAKTHICIVLIWIRNHSKTTGWIKSFHPHSNCRVSTLFYLICRWRNWTLVRLSNLPTLPKWPGGKGQTWDSNQAVWLWSGLRHYNLAYVDTGVANFRASCKYELNVWINEWVMITSWILCIWYYSSSSFNMVFMLNYKYKFLHLKGQHYSNKFLNKCLAHKHITLRNEHGLLSLLLYLRQDRKSVV